MNRMMFAESSVNNNLVFWSEWISIQENPQNDLVSPDHVKYIRCKDKTGADAVSDHHRTLRESAPDSTLQSDMNSVIRGSVHGVVRKLCASYSMRNCFNSITLCTNTYSQVLPV